MANKRLKLTVDDLIDEAKKIPDVGPKAIQGITPQGQPSIPAVTAGVQQIPALGTQAQPTIQPPAPAAGLQPPTAGAPITPPAVTAPGAPPVTDMLKPPTLEQFVEPKTQAFQAIVKQAEPQLRRNIEEMSRKIFGQNVGAESAIGRENVNRLLEEQASFFAPHLERLSAQGAQDFLEAQNRLSGQVFDLIKAGQITGDQAEAGLKGLGIDPKFFKTPAQAQAEQEIQFKKIKLDQAKEEFSKNITDPEQLAKLELINSEEELAFFRETGTTFEEDFAEAIETKKSVKEWQAKIPSIQSHLNETKRQIEDLNKAWIKNPSKIERLEAQRDLLISTLNIINAGGTPTPEALSEEFVTATGGFAKL